MSTHKIPEDFVYLDQYYAQTVKPIKPNIEEIEQHLRYATKENFTGNIVNGYSATSKAVITKKAAEALYKAQELALNIGYSLMIYDSYRPQKAVNSFVEWAQKPEDCLDCKQCYYPTLKQKKDAFQLPDPYIAKQSGHSRGSTVDLTFINKGSKVKEIKKVERVLKNGQKVIYLSDGTIDTWTSFDLFDKCSSHECHHLIDDHYIRNRNIIKDIMICSGFSPLVSEWWHYSLIDEPFPNTYFDFEF